MLYKDQEEIGYKTTHTTQIGSDDLLTYPSDYLTSANTTYSVTPNYQSPYNFPTSFIPYDEGKPGQVLTVDENGKHTWKDPNEFDEDIELRKEHPGLQELYKKFKLAEAEYKMMLRLCKE